MGGEDDGELLAALAVAGVEDPVPGVGVDADQSGDLAGDPGFLPGLPEAAWATDSPRSMAPPGTAQLPLSERRMSRISPASLATMTLTEGTRLLAGGAVGSS